MKAGRLSFIRLPVAGFALTEAADLRSNRDLGAVAR
jgi:hypothetical protein